jgi:hypothetical protein
MEMWFSFQRRVNKTRKEGRGKREKTKTIERKAGRKEERRRENLTISSGKN